MRMTLFRAAAAVFLTLAPPACRKDAAEAAPPAAPRQPIIHFVPTPVGSVLRDTTGSADAERRTFTVNMALDSVHAFYRRLLPDLGWAVISDQGDSATVDMYASRGNQSVWVQIRRLEPARSEYTLLARVGADAPIGDSAR